MCSVKLTAAVTADPSLDREEERPVPPSHPPSRQPQSDRGPQQPAGLQAGRTNIPII